MVRNCGTTNYSSAEVDRLLGFVNKSLPLGKDEWERPASSYNTNKPRGVAERDYERLRRKFKTLYGTRKPTGKAEMPPAIKWAKEIKRAVDEKADVVDMNDGADSDERLVEPDFSFDVDPDESFYSDGEDDSRKQPTVVAGPMTGSANTPSSDDTSEENTSETTCASTRGGYQELLSSPLASNVLEEFASTPRPAPSRSGSSATRPGSLEILPPCKSSAAPKACAAPQLPRKSVVIDLAEAGSRDTLEALMYPTLQTSSNRLGGTNLASFQDATDGGKRVHGFDTDTLEASFAKAKRARAMKATTALKAKLDTVGTSANNSRGSILETILLLREENERKAEIRREEDEQRRRDEVAAREARRVEEKAEAEERRRAEKLEMEDRARRDREEARARTQELVMLIGALTKKA